MNFTDSTFHPNQSEELPTYPLSALHGPAGELFAGLSASRHVSPESFAGPFFPAASAAIGTRMYAYVSPSMPREYAVLWSGLIGCHNRALFAAALGAFRRLKNDLFDELDVDTIESVNKTVPGLCMHLAGQPAGVVLFFEDLIDLVESFDERYPCDDLEWLRAAWKAEPYDWHPHDDGLDPSRWPERVQIDHRFVAKAASISADDIAAFIAHPDAEFSGSAHAPLFDNWLWSAPEPSMPTSPDSWPAQAYLEQAVADNLRAIRWSRPAEVRLSQPAGKLFRDWAESAGRPGPSEGFAPMAQYIEKLPRQAIRLATVLHGLEHGGAAKTMPISSRTIEGAVALSEYHLAHARHALRLATQSGEPAGHPIPDEWYWEQIRVRLAMARGWKTKTELENLLPVRPRPVLDAILARMVAAGVISRSQDINDAEKYRMA